ncbi:serine hydrolase domain-containing protein [Sagittula salina]|uniref:Serine hydrolase n=1 Tax=Sagittula salina TaxID=2820268 RepID=A0A940MQT1_9RHOB|nr:serine hydrolase [Sagittula salina]MBP0481364.1 serine hydrolase [Sagittula salina]
MRRLGYALAVLAVVLASLAAWKREDIIRLMAVQSLFSEDRIVWNFSHMDSLFRAVPLDAGAAPEPLPEGPAVTLPDGWDAWLKRRAITGVVILKSGVRVHEAYRLGTGQADERISWSVAKSYLSGLFGILVAEGHVDSLGAQVVEYVPELKGSAYDGVTILNVLQMSSGVEFDEDYLDFWSDINKMGRVLALGGSMDRFAAGLTVRAHSPGEAWEYVSIDTHVLGMVARAATGRDLPDLMAEKLLRPLGTYGQPYYLTDGYGVAFALGGLNLTTRDYSRMGEMFRQMGRFGGRQIVPADWVAESTRPSARTKEGARQYGYQWWMAADARPGEFMARGVYGQYVYIDRSSGTVIAVNAADRNFREHGAFEDALDMFRRIATGEGKV